MNRLMIASAAILIVAAGAATVNFTFSVTSASITTSGTSVSVSGPATLTVSGVGTDHGTFSVTNASLANVSGGDVTVPFTDTMDHGTLTGNMTFPVGVLVGSAPVSGSATITSATGLYGVLANTTVTGSGFSGSLSGGTLSFSISGAANGKNYTFTVTNASVSISGTSTFSGPASLTLGGNPPDTGTFSATGSLNNISGGNLTVPFTVTLGQGTLTGNMTFPETVLVSSGPVSGSATITSGTGSYSSLTSSTLTASGTMTGSVLSGATLSFSISGAVNTGASGGTDITYNVNVKITSSNPTKNPNQSDQVVGTITTDGTIGTILAHNIKSWDLHLIDLLNSASNIELTPANSQVVEDGDGAGQHIGGGGLTATATGLFYDFSNKNAEFGFQAGTTYGAAHYFCLSDGLYACAAGESIAPNNINTDGVISTPAPVGVQPLAGNSPTITNVVSGVSYGIGMAGFSGMVITGIDTGSWVTITGQNLASTTRVWQASDFAGLGNGLPMSLDGVSVTIDGKPAAICYISPTQLNVQAPQDGTLGSVPVVVTNSLRQSDTVNATFEQFAPGFALLSQPGSPSPTAALYVAAIHNDGTPAVPANYYGSSVNSRPATPGEVLMIYGTGFGPTNPPAPAGQLVNGAPPLADPSLLSITIGGVPATVQYAGMVGLASISSTLSCPPFRMATSRLSRLFAGPRARAEFRSRSRTDLLIRASPEWHNWRRRPRNWTADHRSGA